MAKKRQRRTPVVPRSSEAGRAPQQQESVERLAVSNSPVRVASAPRAVRSGTVPVVRADFSAEYGYVRKDLTRIVVLAALLFGGMAILRILGF